MIYVNNVAMSFSGDTYWTSASIDASLNHIHSRSLQILQWLSNSFTERVSMRADRDVNHALISSLEYFVMVTVTDGCLYLVTEMKVSSFPSCVFDMIFRGSSLGFKSQNAIKSSGIRSCTNYHRLPAPMLCSSTDPRSLYSIVHLKSAVSTTRGSSCMNWSGSYIAIIGQSAGVMIVRSILSFWSSKNN